MISDGQVVRVWQGRLHRARVYFEETEYRSVRTGIQFVPSSQLQSQIVLRGIPSRTSFATPWKYQRG